MLHFDTALKPNRDGLAPDIAAMMDRAFYSRRPKGLNVQFINESGERDEWSFGTERSRDSFLEKLMADGREFALYGE